MNRSDLPNRNRRRKSLAVRAALLVGVIAALGVWLLTVPPGPGLDPDAASYLGAARSLAAGNGYRIPISDWRTPDSTSELAHFPPGYPTAIALPVALGGLAPLNAARLVNATAGFVTVALATWLVISVAGVVAGIGLAAALLVMHAFVIVHLSVLSEPLFLACIVCAVAAMWAFARATGEQSRLVHTVLAGCAGAAAVLVRYAGISVVGAVILWSLLPPASISIRVRRAVITALPAVLFFGAWVVRSYLTSGAHSIRTIGAYGGLGDTIAMGASTIVAWLVPLTSDDTLPARSWIAVALLVLLVFATTRAARLLRRSDIGVAIAATLLLAVCYVLVLVGSRLLADPGIPFDERILSPLLLLMAITVAMAIPTWWRAVRVPARALGAGLFAAWLAAAFRATQDDVAWALENGQDFAQAQWTSSPLLAWARTNASRQPLYSNWPAAIVFHLQRAAHEMPDDSTDMTLREFGDTLRTRGGVVLAFDQPSPDQIGVPALIHAPGLRQVARVADGAVFAPAP